MKKELENKLIDKFSNLFFDNTWVPYLRGLIYQITPNEPFLKDVPRCQIPLPSNESGTVFEAFECDDGWYDLLEDLFSKIEYIKRNESESIEVYFICIKEKLGFLRLCYTINQAGLQPIGYNCIPVEIIKDLIRVAEDKSSNICEITGKYGALCRKTNGHWLKVLCQEKQKELGFEPFGRGILK